MPSAKQIDYVNIGLMLVAFILAIKLPFHLFLLAYAILGPLHYLTEIAWLHNKDYYSKRRSDAWILVGLCAVFTLSFALLQFAEFEWSRSWVEWINSSSLKPVKDFIHQWERSFIFMAFFIAMLMVFVKPPKWRYPLMAVGLVAAYFLNEVPAYIMIIGVMLPTVIHVFVFTGAFMLFGALKSKSSSGYLAVGVFIALVLILANSSPKPENFILNDYWAKTMDASRFSMINYAIADFMGWATPNYRVYSPLGLKMQMFMAFAYTYHYLNWFSKTKIIQWHQVPKKWLYTSAAIWVGAVALYFYDYKIGLLALFFLSVLHVFLEFPLNHLTFVGIFDEVKKRFKN